MCWDYLNLRDRTFDADGLLDEPLGSGERVLVEAAASLWNTGKVDVGYIACAMGGCHLQAIIDAIAIQGGQTLASDADRAIARITGDSGRPVQRDREVPDHPGLSRSPGRPPRERDEEGRHQGR
jgi:hypothetical protein